MRDTYRTSGKPGLNLASYNTDLANFSLFAYTANCKIIRTSPELNRDLSVVMESQRFKSSRADQNSRPEGLIERLALLSI